MELPQQKKTHKQRGLEGNLGHDDHLLDHGLHDELPEKRVLTSRLRHRIIQDLHHEHDVLAVVAVPHWPRSTQRLTHALWPQSNKGFVQVHRKVLRACCLGEKSLPELNRVLHLALSPDPACFGLRNALWCVTLGQGHCDALTLVPPELSEPSQPPPTGGTLSVVNTHHARRQLQLFSRATRKMGTLQGKRLRCCCCF